MNDALDISLESSIYIEDLFEMYGHAQACNCSSLHLIRKSTNACNRTLLFTWCGLFIRENNFIKR